MPHYGYDGGDGEPEIVAALTELFATIEGEVVHNIKEKYWVIGHAIEIAEARGYVKAMGLKGWMYLRFGKGETTARECKQCWKDRDVFDHAYNWWKSGNTDFTPTKLTGPRFSNEICKAYRERLLSDAERLAKRGRNKKKGAKEFREEAARWRSRYDRAKGVILKWGGEDGRESRELVQIELEIAAEEESEGEMTAPLDVRRADPEATAPHNDDADDDNPDPVPEQHPGAPEPTDDADQQSKSASTYQQHPGVDFAEVHDGLARERRRLNHMMAVTSVPNKQQHLGVGFVVVDEIVPPKRTPRPTKPLLRLATSPESLGTLVTPAEVPETLVEKVKRGGGWPKDKKRGPRVPKQQNAKQKEG
jgi:hypothetical protein